MNASLSMILENRRLDRWGELLARSPAQLNGLQEADAELVPLPGGQQLLAVTIDTVAEELALGLYRDPETVGWVAAVASLSDLAAVGAEPIGLVVSVTLPREDASAFQEGVGRGLSAACRAANTFVLGGDTNEADAPSVTVCAIGTVPRDRVVRRVGARPGDLVYATGPLGAGAACAARAVLGLPDAVYAESLYRPQPRLIEGRFVGRFATCAMDTSDGLVATLDQLARLNHVGFDLDAAAPMDLLEPGARRVCQTLRLSPLAALAAHHGEFEIVFTVPPAEQARFEKTAAAACLSPLRLGRVAVEPGLRIGGRTLDGARIRNLSEMAGGDPSRYLSELVRLVGE